MHYLKSAEEYSVRFAIDHADELLLRYAAYQYRFGLFDSVHHDGYYVKMALAWAISIAFIKLREETLQYLNHNKLDY